MHATAWSVMEGPFAVTCNASSTTSSMLPWRPSSSLKTSAISASFGNAPCLWGEDAVAADEEAGMASVAMAVPSIAMGTGGIGDV